MMAGEVIGIKDLLNTMQRLNVQMTTKTGARMVAAAGGVVRKGAKAIAQSKGLRKSGSLISNIAIKREKNAPAGTVQYNLGVRHGREYAKRNRNVVKYLAVGQRGRVVTRYKNDPYYWRFIHFGTKYIKPVPFIVDALNTKRLEAIAAMSAVIERDVLKGRL